MSKRRLFESKKKYRLRQGHNERCRRYYQRHLSKKAKEKRLREETKRERTKNNEELIRKVVNTCLKQKEVETTTTINDWLL